jgi:regulator of replication initiation timing
LAGSGTFPLRRNFLAGTGAHCRKGVQQLPARVQARRNKGNSTKMTASRSKAEQRYAEIQKREHSIRQELDNATRLRLEKSAKLRQLRLAKEAEDAAEKQAAKDIKAASKSALKKPRVRPSAL